MTYLVLTAASSVEVSGFLERLVENTGLFLRRRLRVDVFSPRFPGDNSDDVAPRNHEVAFDDTPNISHPNCTETTNNEWSVLYARSSSRSSSHPPFPPSPPLQDFQALPPAKKKRGVQKVWTESKKLFMKTVWRRQAGLKLSDKLVPERDGSKWYEALFSKSRKSVATRK